MGSRHQVSAGGIVTPKSSDNVRKGQRGVNAKRDPPTYDMSFISDFFNFL
jgi:hypothetical protein